MSDILFKFRVPKRSRDLIKMIRALDAECRNCAPLTPLDCITNCDAWKLKNELKKLRQTMDKSNFAKDLFNALKNETRLHILSTIVNGRYSLNQLRKELGKTGSMAYGDTLNEKHVQSLVDVGLVAQAQEQYYSTMFGDRLTELLDGFNDFVKFLPSHSECHEETMLIALLTGPKTFQEVKTYISPRIASRILKRLKIADLIETPKERDYIFFFKSKRDPEKETLSSSERKVYVNISKEGISARKLADTTGISLRRTYKYLRGLKGKKLVFTRKTPKAYKLTNKGRKLANLLHGFQSLVEEIWKSSVLIASNEKS